MDITNRIMQQSTSELQLVLLENGKEEVLSPVSEQNPWEVSVDTILEALKTQMISYFRVKDRKKLMIACQKRNVTAIVGLVRANKKMIFKDKKSIFNPFIRPTRLLKTLEAVLITNA